MVRKTGNFDRKDPVIYQQHLAAISQKRSTKLKEQLSQDQRIVSKLSKELLEDLYCAQKMSMGDIAKLHNCSRVYVMKLLRKYDLPIRTKSAARGEAKKKGKNVGFSSINENFFKNQSPEMAYVLGFIYSDGNLSNQLDFFSISQKEPEILYKIKNWMSADHPIVRKAKQDIHMLTIGNKVMINDLMSLGLTPNKSLDVKFPVLDKDLHSHFIRGYFDGDGCIACFSTWRLSFTCGSRQFLEGLSTAICTYAETGLRPVYSHPTRNAHQLSYSKGADLVKIFDFFYDHYTVQKGNYLKRKYESFLSYRTNRP